MEAEVKRFVLAILAIVCVLALAYTGSSFAQAQTSSPGVIVENGKGADNARIQRAINNAQGNPITILLRPGSQCYSIAGPIDLASNVTIDSASAPDRWCMERATPPATNNSTELHWFRVAGKAVDNFTMRNANLYGLGPGDVAREERQSFVDFGLVFNQRISDPQNASLYSRNLLLQHVTFDKFYGVCTFTRYVDGVEFDDVVCNDPTKGGLIFSFGARNGFILNSEATLTGDDALAFTSGGSAPGDALVTNFDVHNAHLSQEADGLGCGSLCIRGATDIVATDSSVGSGGAPGSVGIRNSTDSAHEWSSSDITIDGTFGVGSLVSSSTIRPDIDESGVRVDDPGAANIRIMDNSIYYDPDQCGIEITSRTPENAVTTSPNSFVPDGPNNVCGLNSGEDLLALAWLSSQ